MGHYLCCSVYVVSASVAYVFILVRDIVYVCSCTCGFVASGVWSVAAAASAHRKVLVCCKMKRRPLGVQNGLRCMRRSCGCILPAGLHQLFPAVFVFVSVCPCFSVWHAILGAGF